MTCPLNADAPKALDSRTLPPANRSALRRSRMLAGTLIALVSIVALFYAYCLVFSRSMSLDEGYLMITVEAFNHGHALYDVVFTQYGPFYYFYQWFVRTVLTIPLTHDATRILCTVHWFIAALLSGIAAWRMTNSAWAALFVALQAVVHLSRVANEPGHPQELVVMLLAAGALVATRSLRTGLAIEALALIAALLVFVKINVGAFFAFAVLLAMKCHASDRFARGCWSVLPLAISAALPFALMRSHLAEPWCRHYAVLASCATFVALWVARSAAVPNVLPRRIWTTAGGTFVAVSAVLLGLTFFTGTSLQGFVEGLLRTPMRLPKIAVLPIELSSAVVLNAILATGLGVVTATCLGRSRAGVYLAAALKLAFAVTGALWLVGDARQQLAYLLPWAWLVAVPHDGENRWGARESFPRVFLSLASAWQSLQAYPIAGTQLTLATFLLVLAFGVCLSDALPTLCRARWTEHSLARLSVDTRIWLQTLAGAALLFLFANAWCKLPAVRREHAALRSLGLPGARHVRTDDETGEFYRTLTRYLAAESDTFVTYPGLNSLYFWTGKRPPTHLNGTGWGQFTHAQQEQILASLGKASRPKIVVAEPLIRRWGAPVTEAIRPLTRYVTEDCRPLVRIGQYIVFEPKSPREVIAANGRNKL